MFLRLVGVFFFFSVLGIISAEIFEECEDMDSGTYVSYALNCSVYIYCDNDNSIMDNCDEGQYFDGEGCDLKENVPCALDETEGVEVEGDGDEDGEVDGEVEGEGEGESEGDGDGGEAETEESVSQEVETTMPTPQNTTVVDSTLAPLDNVTLNSWDIPPVIRDTCPAADDPNQIVLIASNNSCMDYFVCYHGHAIGMHCMDHLHFNLATGKCDFPENAKCKLSIQPPSEVHKCLPHMKEFFPHQTKCNYFYYCIKGYQTVQQCPFYYGWDVEKRICVHMAHAKCYNDAT